ncbi:DNA topoisomerase 2 isoform X2 [Chrysoperla carnea]|uniref:DNA topoisomerase 2 isoform X2 n=1 Tax=Chrysoperla carnea TaxID=189513 RepID=UPI001D06A45F|nr:DNA topoisomerase 2 isoform X2 [Chrysoperla carnea]
MRKTLLTTGIISYGGLSLLYLKRSRFIRNLNFTYYNSHRKMSNIANGGGDPAPPKKGGGGSIEKMYQKKSQLEHILLRPDTYIGSVERVEELQWIYDTEQERMVQKQISFVPGLYKIFDEILVNAADNKQRDPKMDMIKIDINQEENLVSVWNNGKGIPVVMHKEEKMYVPTMIFGHLLTSSNYNDDEDKVTGGRNGYGAKLCNIFSNKFVVETSSEEFGYCFKQTWTNNMTKTTEPKIKACVGNDYTKITFSPDLTKFKMEKLEDDIVLLMSRRAYDVAASTRGVKVYLNGKKLPINNFKAYIDLYLKGKEDDTSQPLKVIYETVNERWEVAVTISDKGFQQVSFVNSIATTKGGRHVDNVTDGIVKQLIEVLKKKNKGGVQIKPFQVKNHMWVFINCLIVNPTFDSQTKENMTLQAKSFGSKCTLSEKFIAAVAKSGIVESVLSWAKFKAQNELAKTSGKKNVKLKGIPKLEDANEAGTKNAYKCTLILTEGDSAKSLVVSGFAVIGRDYYGVFPLRGKLLNVREATHKQILENAEINNIIKILGLQYKKKYNSPEDLKTLRYGKLMIMTDQDQDGSHIKGLLINFIHHNWPELLQQEFLEEFITPIVKVTKSNRELSFYSLPEFEEWQRDTPNSKSWKVKYYKGLGTSTSKEAKEYFTNMLRHRIKFKYEGPNDDFAITLAFSKKCIENRKEWLTDHMVESRRRKEMGLTERYLYNKDTKEITYAQFINMELILFSNADNVRSIPSLVDGLKPGQRKVLFTCIKRNDKREVKVAQLAGSVAELSAYHHGEVSLCMTIVNLAQNFVGSNNINLLMPNGQFGTRLNGGKDAASPRYIFTKMSDLTRLIFNPHDDPLLQHEYDDNQKIEPVWYIPILPMVLVNGADGIGTGWMTKIPNYNPRDIVKNLRLMLDGEEPKNMTPWYKNFTGTIDDCGDQRYVVSGEISILDDDKIEITELPVGTWTQNYKENVLEPMLHGSEKQKAVLADYKEYNTDTTVRIVVKTLPGQLRNLQSEGLHKVFKLQSSMTTSSMVCFDEMGVLRKFNSVMEILKEFYTLRLKMYAKRKDYMEGCLEAEAKRLSNRARFILEKCDRKLIVENKRRKDMIEELVKAGYDPDPVRVWKKKQVNNDEEGDDANASQESQDEDEGDDEEKTDEQLEKEFQGSEGVKNFDYLLGMAMWMLTKEKKDQLLRERDNKLHELNVLKAKTPSDLWRADLDKFSEELNKVEAKERKDEEGEIKKLKGAKGKGSKKINLDDTLPSAIGERVKPVISEEMLKKFAAATKGKENKAKKQMNISGSDPDNVDELDKLVEKNSKKTLASKLAKGASTEITDIGEKPKKGRTAKPKDGLKQTTLTFKKKDDDDDPPPPPRPATARRAATKVKNYNFDEDNYDKFSDDSGNEMLVDNHGISSEHQVQTVTADSDSGSETPPKNNESAESLFDSLVGSNANSKDKSSEEKKAEKRKRAPKKKIDSDSDASIQSIDDDSNDEAPKKPAPKKKKKLFTAEKDTAPPKEKKKAAPRPRKPKKKDSSDDEFDVDIIEASPVINRPGRARKTVAKYALDSDSNSD